MDSLAAAVFLLILIFVFGFFKFAEDIKRINDKLDALIAGAQAKMPPVKSGGDLIHLAVEAGRVMLQRAKERRARKRPKDKDLQPIPQLFDEAGFRQFCKKLLEKVNGAASIEDVKLTEKEWVGELSREQFIAFRTRLEERGIICIIDKRGTRGWRANSNGSYQWARERLEKLAK